MATDGVKKKDASGGSSDIGPEPQIGKQNGTAPLQDIAPDSKDTQEAAEKQNTQRKCAAKNLKPSVFRNGDKLVAEHGSKSVTFLFRVESV